MHTHTMHTDVDTRMREPARLDDIRRLRLLDTPAEEPFDRLTRLAARLLRAPIALVSVVDGHRQFFKSAYGMPEPWASRRETPLTHSFCKHVVARAVPLSIADAKTHPLVCQNAAIGDLNVVAYLGAPLTLATGTTIGSFCVIDTQPRTWTTDEQHTMVDLAASIMSEIALRVAYDDAGRHPLYIPAIVVASEAGIAQVVRAMRGAGLAVTGIPDNEQAPASANAHALIGPNGGERNAVGDAADGQRGRLTKRQAEVFDLLMHGLQTKEIARALNLSHRTVEVHRAMIRERLHVSNFSNLIKQRLGGNGTE